MNSEENPDGGQGKVSIQVGGVSITMGEPNKPGVQLAREDLHQDVNEEDEEGSEEKRDIDQAEDVEIGGVVDVFINSLRQIRSLLVG